MGDVNFDGVIDSQDSAMIAQFDVKLEAFADKQLKAADVDLNRKVGVKDKTYVDMYIELGADAGVAYVGLYSYEGFDSNIVGDKNEEPTTEPTTEPITEPDTEPSNQKPTHAQKPTKPSASEKTEGTVATTTPAENPQTGDTSNLGLWIMLAIISSGFGIFALSYGKRDKGTRYR